MASGDTLCVFTPRNAELPASNFAVFSARNNHPTLRFADGTALSAIFIGVMPRHYSGGGITVYLTWSCTLTTGTVGWTVEIERIGDGQQDLDSDGFASAQTVTAATVPGTNGLTDITNVAVTSGANMDSLAAGEAFRIRVTRDTTNDTSTGIAELIAVEIKES